MSTINMDAKGKDAILELIKCPICLEIYTDPRKYNDLDNINWHIREYMWLLSYVM